MVKGVYVAGLVLYLAVLPLAIYNFWIHRWAGLLAWYYLTAFCILRIVAGALGTSQGDSLAASILVGVGASPLLLSVDGLVHEARAYRNPTQNISKWLGWGFLYIITALIAAAIALTATGAMDVYKGQPKPASLSHWKLGSALMIVAWVLEVAWTCFSLLPSQARRNAPAYWQGTVILGGALIALFFLGIRVIYAHVAVMTQRQDLSPVYGTTAVRLVLMFFPEALTTIFIIFIGFATGRSLSIPRPSASTTPWRR